MRKSEANLFTQIPQYQKCENIKYRGIINPPNEAVFLSFGDIKNKVFSRHRDKTAIIKMLRIKETYEDYWQRTRNRFAETAL
jgi:hypothetical protein